MVITKSEQQKIEDLVAFMEKELPNGCNVVMCDTCPLENTQPGTLRNEICEFLRRSWNNMKDM